MITNVQKIFLTVPTILKRPNDTKTVSKWSKTLLKRYPNDQVTEKVSLLCHNGKRGWTNRVGRLNESWTGWSRYGHDHVTKTKDPL